ASPLPRAVAWPPVPPACGKGLPSPATASGSAGTPHRRPAGAAVAPAAPVPAVVPGHPEPPPLGSPLIREPERTRSQGRGIWSQPVRWPRRGRAADRSAARAGVGPARASRSPYGRCLLATVCTVAHHGWDDTTYDDMGDGEWRAQRSPSVVPPSLRWAGAGGAAYPAPGHREPAIGRYARGSRGLCLPGDQPVRSPAFRRSSGAPCDLDVAAHVPTIIQQRTPSCQSLVDIREEPVAAAPRRTATAAAVIRLVPVIMLTQQGVDLSPQRRTARQLVPVAVGPRSRLGFVDLRLHPARGALAVLAVAGLEQRLDARVRPRWLLLRPLVVLLHLPRERRLLVPPRFEFVLDGDAGLGVEFVERDGRVNAHLRLHLLD